MSYQILHHRQDGRIELHEFETQDEAKTEFLLLMASLPLGEALELNQITPLMLSEEHRP